MQPSPNQSRRLGDCKPSICGGTPSHPHIIYLHTLTYYTFTPSYTIPSHPHILHLHTIIYYTFTPSHTTPSHPHTHAAPHKDLLQGTIQTLMRTSMRVSLMGPPRRRDSLPLSPLPTSPQVTPPQQGAPAFPHLHNHPHHLHQQQVHTQQFWSCHYFTMFAKHTSSHTIIYS